jgi:hypothetical protein
MPAPFGRIGFEMAYVLNLSVSAKATLHFEKVPRAPTALSQVSSKPANFAELIGGPDLELLDLQFEPPRRYRKFRAQTVELGQRFPHRQRHGILEVLAGDADRATVYNRHENQGQQACDQEPTRKKT